MEAGTVRRRREPAASTDPAEGGQLVLTPSPIPARSASPRSP